MAIDYLVNVLKPPASPSELPGSGGWSSLESRIGASLPDDYKEFIESYGSGQIDKFLWVFNPFSTNTNLNLENQIDTQIKVLSDLQSYGESIPFDIFPEKGGILPFGITDNGDVLFWKTTLNSKEWSVVVNGARSPEWQSFDCSMSHFLADILRKKIVCNIFPSAFPGNVPVFDPAP